MLKQQFDFVVVDTPPAFDDHVLAAFDQSDLVALLATLDIPALKNLKLTLETLDLLNYPRDRWRIVLNRADSKVGLALDEVEKTLKAPIAAQIPSSRDVPASINRGVPIVLDDPKHPVSARPSGPSPSNDVASGTAIDGWPAADRAAAPIGAAGCAEEDQDMSLADRSPQPSATAASPSAESGADGRLHGRGRRGPGAVGDPFADLKRTVHQTLLDNLGPKLYDSRLTQSELEQKVRARRCRRSCAQDDTPLTVADRARIAQEIADDILGYGPLEPYLRDPDVTEVMVNGSDSIYIERGRAASTEVAGHVHRRGAPAPHDRQDRGPGRPSGRRGQPDGRRPAARRQPGQRDHPAARDRRVAADDPQVRRPTRTRSTT